MPNGNSSREPEPARARNMAVPRLLFRAAKLLLRGDAYRARHVLDDAYVQWRIPPPAIPWLADVIARLEPAGIAPAQLAAPVDIVIPVHDGLTHLERLFSTLFEHTDASHRILLADDASTDPAVAALLGVAAARPNVRILRSETNLGFVATVNRAMAAISGHAILLNTDTEVPRGWVERLMRPIVGEPRVASATPFSNSAAMFGFPLPERVNPLPAGLALRQVDEAFARLSPAFDPSLEAPTGIGFCMGVNLGRMAGGRPVRRGHLRPRLWRGDRLVPDAPPRPDGATCWRRTCSSTMRTPARSAARRSARSWTPTCAFCTGAGRPIIVNLPGSGGVIRGRRGERGRASCSRRTVRSRLPLLATGPRRMGSRPLRHRPRCTSRFVALIASQPSAQPATSTRTSSESVALFRSLARFRTSIVI